jgi:ATP-dependent DNA helicase RecQ
LRFDFLLTSAILYNASPMPELREQLQELFGLDDFRPFQREVIEEVLAGRDVLCVMPTGAGKSLCYQLPAAVQGGLTVVVSPLIALMEDQVRQLRDEGINAALLNSSLTPAMQREAISQIEAGFEGLLYVAPERFFHAGFRPLLERLKVTLLAIDEAHCISVWGHDFRPEYSQLGEVRQRMGMPTTIALTATATEDVRGDIIRGLGLREPHIVITGFDRPNLSYQCQRVSKVKAKDAELIRLLQEADGSAIVYCSTRKAVDELAPHLGQHLNGRAVVPYHAGMDQDARATAQERFMQSPKSIAVATVAFGMGINKPDIRLVVHYNIPGTLENYYQEAGRAGRDGLPARCVLLYSFQDKMIQEFFIDKIGDEGNGQDPQFIASLKQRASQKLDLMVQYAQTHRCRRKQILDYFGDESEVIDCHCDICAPGESAVSLPPGTVLPDEVVTLARQVLSAIARLNSKFGVGVIAEVLAGDRNERTDRWGFDQLTVFGLLARYPTKRIIAMVHRMIESGLARQKDVGRGKPIFVVELTTSGIAVMKGAQPPPVTLADLLPRRGTRASGTNPRALGTNPRALRASGDDQTLVDQSLDLDAPAQERFDRLRAVRTELARDRQLPPYCICLDSTLKLIASVMPDTLERLEQIKGMGPYKVKMYGPKLLDALSGSQREH